MNRGGHRGGPRGRGGDRGFHGAPSSSFQPNGRYEGPRDGWGPPSDSGGGWGGPSRGPPGGSSRGRGGGMGGPQNSSRCWGRDDVPAGSWYRGGGGPGGPPRGAPRGGPRGGPGYYGRRRGRGGGGGRGHYEQQEEYNRDDSVNMKEAPPPPKKGPPSFCRQFAYYGQCHFGNRCRYPHILECVGYIPDGHGGESVRCCVVNPPASEIYTGGKDKKLKRWQVCQGAAGGECDSTGDPLLELNCISSKEMEEEVVSLFLLGGALFASLSNGIIKAFLHNGHCTELKGHEKSVYSILLVEGVLISGDWGGCLYFWQFNKDTQLFIKVHSLQTQGSISCMQTAAIAAPPPAAAAAVGAAAPSAPAAPPTAVPALGATQTDPSTTSPTTKKVLWVGGTALQIIDLQNLQILRILDISDVKGNGPPLVLSLLPFNDFLLVGFASGAITAYTADGERQYCFSSNYLSAMEGLMSPSGPVLVFGGKNSSLNVLKVPQFLEEGSLIAHDEGDIRAVCSLGSTHFISCGDDGAIAIWRWAQKKEEKE